MTSFNNQEAPDWSKVLVILLAYAHKQIRLYNWATGTTDTKRKADDFVMATVEKYLSNPEKFDSERSNSKDSFINYLKFNILRRLIYNAANAPRNKNALTREQVDKKFLTMIANSQNITTIIDFDTIAKDVKKQLITDKYLVDIFEGLCSGYERKDLCELLDLTPNDYDNHVRRLRRVVEKTLKKHNYGRNKQRKNS